MIDAECNKIVKEITPDIIHFHNIAGFGPNIFKFKGKIKNIFTAHDYWLVCQNSKLVRPNKSLCGHPTACASCQIATMRPVQTWRYFNRFNLDSLNLIIAPSEYMKNRLLNFGIKLKIEVIPNFVNTSITDPKCNNDRTHLLFVGALEKHKGILDLLNKYPEIYDRFKVPLHIVGSGSLDNKINNIIKANHMGGKIVFLGKISKEFLLNEYKNALALIIPSTWPENNPMVALESLSNGTPVIGKRSGGIPEIVSLLNPNLVYNSDEDLIEAIKYIFFDKDIGNKALTIFKENYSEGVFMSRYLRIMNS